MHKVHVTTIVKDDLPAVFAAITDHRKFLSGDGMACHVIKKGQPEANGLGAIRTVRANKYTLTEKITAFELNKSYDYLLTDIKPKINLTHHNGWLELKELDEGTQVDWHSHFTCHTPVIGHFIGWQLKKSLEKIFTQRLKQLNK